MNGYLIAFFLLVIAAAVILIIIRDAITVDPEKAKAALRRVRALFSRSA